MNDGPPPAVGLLTDTDTGARLGTAFAISDGWGLTAFHCVGDLAAGQVTHPRVTVGLPVVGDVTATVEEHDRRLDVALLRLASPLPAGVAPLRLTDRARVHDQYRALGFPTASVDRRGFAVSGTVTDPAGTLAGGEPIVQLFCEQMLGNLPLQGMSGGPVLVGEPELVVGVVRRQQPRPDMPALGIGGSFFATPVAAVARLWPQVGERLVRPSTERLQSLLALSLDESGRLPGVRDVSPYDAGVSLSAYGARPGGDPYVARDADALLRSLVRTEPRVLVVGDSAAGKSRSALEAVRAELPDAALLAPVARSETLRQLLAVNPAADGRPVVVWLDDLEYFLGPNGLDLPLLDDLARQPARWVVVATVRAGVFERLSADRVTQPVLDRFGAGQVELPGDLSPGERERAGTTYPDEDFSTAGIGEQLIAAKELRARYRNRTTSFTGADRDRADGQAIVQATVDWQRAGTTRSIPEHQLRRLYEDYLVARYPNLDPAPEHFDRGLTWAREPVASRISLLRVVTRTPERTFQAPDYLLELDDAREIADVTWTLLLDSDDVDELMSAAYAALSQDRWDVAMTAYERIAGTGDRDLAAIADCNRAVLLAEEGRLLAAARLYREVIAYGVETQTPRAQNNLGALLVAEGRLAEAAELFAEAAGSAHHEEAQRAMLELALVRALEQDYENAVRLSDEARYGENRLWSLNAAALRSSTEARGHSTAMVESYRAAVERYAWDGDLAAGQAAYDQAEADGNHEEMGRIAFGLAVRSWLSGDVERAATQAGRAVGSGGSEWASLGNTLSSVIAAAEASAEASDSSLVAIRASLDTAPVDGLQFNRQSERLDLGRMRERVGDLAGARAAYEAVRAADDVWWSPLGSLSLGTLLFNEGDLDGAHGHYLAAVESGHPFAAPAAMLTLGLLLEENGRLAEAVSAYQSVLTFDAVEPRQDATLQLARVLAERDDLPAAVDTLRSTVFEARTDFSAEAAWQLGRLLVRQGDLPGAQDAFQQAVGADYPEISPYAALELGDVLEATGDLAAARERWADAARWNHPEVTEPANARLAETAQD